MRATGVYQEKAVADAALLPNGFGAASVLAAGVGALALGVCTAAAEVSPHVKSLFLFYRAGGPLSGESTTAIVVWLLCWGLLGSLWNAKTIAMKRVNVVAFVLVVVSLLLTFPPVLERL